MNQNGRNNHCNQRVLDVSPGLYWSCSWITGRRARNQALHAAFQGLPGIFMATRLTGYLRWLHLVDVAVYFYNAWWIKINQIVFEQPAPTVRANSMNVMGFNFAIAAPFVEKGKLTSAGWLVAGSGPRWCRNSTSRRLRWDGFSSTSALSSAWLGQRGDGVRRQRSRRNAVRGRAAHDWPSTASSSRCPVHGLASRPETTRLQSHPGLLLRCIWHTLGPIYLRGS